jgi:hypothetical protein
MKTISETFSLTCAPDRVWALFLDEGYLRSLYLEELKFSAFTVLEMGEATRRLRVVPRVALPAVLEKLIGESFVYEEHATLDRAPGVWTWKMVQPQDAKPKKALVVTHGTIRVEADGEGKCRRTDTVTIEAHVLGLGGLIESTVEKEVRSSWSKEIPFLQRRIASGAA